ncbi:MULTISPECIES: hypothetical protein [Cycloclasticus]|jgi:hypothetical protein|uniref:Uncharacterized protein n=1 Tax=Cycloclasticus pugetii TaxID=34068 RepID=A0AB33Z3F0_9GAMM|nr:MULTISPECIES: hypothetical protein [Cycloclasticus]ATI03066.1 hypothetical protein CPC19_06140 [Cycloclasticus sp. PY97N]EPD13820.1 hypothetical protein L196_04766 [Cycloclasticus pugetii]
MPEWLTDLNKIGSISSILGLIVTIFIFVEARKIRNSFLRRARLPEINKELAKATSNVSDQLKNWGEDKTPALEAFSNVKALLENIKPKLPSEEKNKVKDYLSRLQPKKYLFVNTSLAELGEDSAWELYTELSGLVTSLQQLAKDSKWD